MWASNDEIKIKSNIEGVTVSTKVVSISLLRFSVQILPKKINEKLSTY